MTPLLSNITVLAAEAGGGGGAAAPAAPGASGLMLLIPMIAIFALWIFMTTRSQKKRQKERDQMLDAIRPKDDVVTIGGIKGRVIKVDGEDYVLRVDAEKDVKITVTKGAISRKVGEDAPQ